MDVQLEELYLAYRKAKKEAFPDTNCAHGLKFDLYERSLSINLSRLRTQLNRATPTWQDDINFLGSATCIPKSVECPTTINEKPPIHFQSSNPLEQWNSQWKSGKRAKGGIFLSVKSLESQRAG